MCYFFGFVSPVVPNFPFCWHVDEDKVGLLAKKKMSVDNNNNNKKNVVDNINTNRARCRTRCLGDRKTLFSIPKGSSRWADPNARVPGFVPRERKKASSGLQDDPLGSDTGPLGTPPPIKSAITEPEQRFRLQSPEMWPPEPVCE